MICRAFIFFVFVVLLIEIMQKKIKKGLPQLKPGERYISGAEMFKEQLKELPKKILTPEQLLSYFGPFFDHLETEEWFIHKKKPTVDDIERLADQFKVPAFGYPQTFYAIINHTLTRDEFTRLANKKKS